MLAQVSWTSVCMRVCVMDKVCVCVCVCVCVRAQACLKVSGCMRTYIPAQAYWASIFSQDSWEKKVLNGMPLAPAAPCTCIAFGPAEDCEAGLWYEEFFTNYHLEICVQALRLCLDILICMAR